MTNHSNPESDNKAELKREQTEGSLDRETADRQDSGHPRKSGRSKREIMEELSRARFPWDD
ncbi:hypothetical protein [Polynucleobacter sp. MWH-UH35A]|uniref:hypothetical protein n=1 Tax=Polynucleobacter sp. MWH-UH35A TaxID=1855619 RepID=UPI001BFD17AF|nr:hypothetical protein [Polynucleobacter sp. MWH-UH35A]QWD59551.1 hypothetical protein ICV36_06995 [Polynucleobacter sp. MWH-UH35A]